MADQYQSVPAHFGFNFTKTVHHDATASLDPRNVTLPTPCSVLITGAGRGLGEAHAIAFAKAGASDIILTSRTLSQLESVKRKVLAVNRNIKVSTFVCDVANEQDVASLAEHVEKEHGRLDVLDNNAGYLDHGYQPLTSVPADGFDRVLKVNVTGVFLVTRAMIPLMLTSPNGLKSVIAIGSATAHVAGESIAMGLSKLAVSRFMEYVASAYASEGLMAYTVMPGAVPTEMNMNDSVPEALRELVKAIADTAELSAAMLVWLAKEPRKWLSGRYVSAQWDVDELEAMKEEIVQKDKLKFQMTV